MGCRNNPPHVRNKQWLADLKALILRVDGEKVLSFRSLVQPTNKGPQATDRVRLDLQFPERKPASIVWLK